LQNALARKLPFCYATMLGSHNSGITLADGYGTLDPYFQKYFEWVKFAVSARLKPSILPTTPDLLRLALEQGCRHVTGLHC
jgi:hypothetical protein